MVPAVSSATVCSTPVSTVAPSPVSVVGIDGTGELSGVKSIASGAGGYCAILTSGGVDCWGYGFQGLLGDGNYYTTGNFGSATPVSVKAVSGTGSLSGVTSLASDTHGYCAFSLQAALTVGDGATTVRSVTGTTTPPATLEAPPP